MSRRRDDDDEEEMDPEEEYYASDDDDGDDYAALKSGGGRKRNRSEFIDDRAEEVDEDEDEEEEDDDDDYDGGGGGGRPKQKRRSGSQFFDEYAAVASDDDEEEDDAEDDFIDPTLDLPEEDDGRLNRHRLLPRDDDQEDIEEMEKRLQERYMSRRHQVEYDDEATEVEQQALLPSVRDPKLWMVKCAIGREREVAVCLMQKSIDKGSEVQIRSAIALDHLKNYIYIEADKEAHVKEVCKGMRNIYAAKIMLVPIKEMADVLSVESKAIDLGRDTWIRMKNGTYKGDLAKVVDVDNVRQRVTVKLIPRVDLQALAAKLDGRDVPKKKAFIPPPRFLNIEEAGELHLRVERKKDPISGDYFDCIGGMMFKDGFLYKNVAMKSVSTQNVQPSFDELEKFRQLSEGGESDMANLSTLFANRKKGHFVKGDRVIVIKGDLKNLKGWVEKVEEDTVHIKPKEKGLPKTLDFFERELCKYFEPGNHVKVVSGVSEGTTGMVVSVEGHVVIIVSDTTKETLRVFADNVVESSEVTSGVTRIGDYELHDLVQLDDRSFGLIIRVESEAFHVLKGGEGDKPSVGLVRLREIKNKIERKNYAVDRNNDSLSVKDVVKVVEGPCKGTQGPIEHIHNGYLFIHDRHHLEHAGFVCAKARSCVAVGARPNGHRNGDSLSRFAQPRTPLRDPLSSMRPPRGGPPMHSGGRHRGGRGHDALVGAVIKVRIGPYKGYKGRVVDVKGTMVRVELESQMKVITVDRQSISDNVNVSTPFRETTSRYGMGSETPMHPSRTPLHPMMTPMRDPGATPIHDGMRTPMRDRAWNPYTPMSPPRDNWEDGNPGSWATSPQYQPGSPPRRAYEAPTPGSGWSNTPSGSYSEAGTPRDNSTAYANAPSPYLPSTPGGQPPMTPSSAYLPGTPGGQPMTPGGGALDMMSPVVGGESEGPWVLPDILVNVRRSGDDIVLGVVKELLPDGSCRIALGANGSGDTVTALPGDIDVVVPRKNDRIKIMGGAQRGATGKLIGVDGVDGIVKVDDTLDVKILDMDSLAKLAT
ncbi:hypothetical protein LIER_36587 [Lithospermum erythrorhizon]|uniref:Transcription elongation factor SPT5 n=1 Tax=Lithospermum erythrorhizon TaxID=34254 RepID=A0AAV3P8J7_LITER